MNALLVRSYSSPSLSSPSLLTTLDDPDNFKNLGSSTKTPEAPFYTTLTPLAPRRASRPKANRLENIELEKILKNSLIPL